MKNSIIQSSVVATLATFLIAGPLLNISPSYANQKKDDDKKIEKLENSKKDPQAKLDTDLARLNQLKAAHTVAELDALAVKGDCFTNCAPSSAGGKCPDMLFTDGVITAGAAVSVSDKKFIVTDHDQIKADLAVSYPAVTSAKGLSLCEAVKPQLDKYAYLGGLQGCQDAVNSCRWVAADKEIAELEVTVKADKEAVAAIDKQIEAVSNREDAMENSDCSDCQASYYGTNEMNTAQKIALITGAFTPIIGMGLNTAMTIHGQSMYANEYNTYCGTGLTIGIPCNAPSALTGTYGGGLSSTIFGGGYGYSIGGGLSGGGVGISSPYAFAGGGLATGIGIASAIGGAGISSPYAFAGGGISSPYAFAGGGIVGMASPYAMAGGISSPYAFAGGGLSTAGGIASAIGIASPYSFAGGGIAMASPYSLAGGIGLASGGIGLASPYSFAGGGIAMASPYSFAGGIGLAGGVAMASPYSFAGGMAIGGTPFVNPYGGSIGGFSMATGIGAGIASPYSFAGGIGVASGGFSTASPYSYAGGIGLATGYAGIGGGIGYPGGIGGGIGGYNPYSGSGQYGSLYNASLSEQMLQAQRAAQSGQDLMLSQQQLYQAQARYSQTAQQAYSGGYGGYGGGLGGVTGGVGFGLSGYGGYGGIGTGYNGYMGGAPIVGAGGSAL